MTIEQRVQVRQAEAQLLRDAGDNAGAYAVLAQALVEHPDQPDLLYDIAMVAEKLDKLDVVEARLQQLIALNPENAQALNALGYTLVDRTTRTAEGYRADRARAQARPRGSVHPRQHGLGAIPAGQSRRRRKTYLRQRARRAARRGDRRAPGRSALGEGRAGASAGSLAVAAEVDTRQSGAARDDAPATRRNRWPRDARRGNAGGRLSRPFFSPPAPPRRRARRRRVVPRADAPFAIDGRLSVRRGSGGAHREFQLAACAAARRCSSCRRRSARRSPRSRGDARPRATSFVAPTGRRESAAPGRRSPSARSGRRSRRRPLGVDRRRAAPECAAFDRARRRWAGRCVLRQDGWEIVYAYADDDARLARRGCGSRNPISRFASSSCSGNDVRRAFRACARAATMPPCDRSSVPAPAKLNLFLHVTGRARRRPPRARNAVRRARLRRHDRTRASRRRRDPPRRRLAGRRRRTRTSRCARRARSRARADAARAPTSRSTKRIPVGGGLGGGSSDAASVLLALNRLWGLDLPRAQLMAIGLALGADVPFFLFGEPAFARGIGEILRAGDRCRRCGLR